MLVVYLAHPVSGNVERNLRDVRGWIRKLELERQDVAIVANWIVECEIFDDADAAQREQGLRRDCAVIEKCDELWYCGVPRDQPTNGMLREIQHAELNGKPIRWMGEWHE